ncbi:hypothetical protein H8356DRAFT_1308042 [Neocallimastix lanati (nom. inval.)]|nr:hypothetical protein H8356DRAFT_1308042 [Neocallimastix sp. JGI-2020a]
MICNETQDAILVDIMNFVRLQKKLHQDNVSKLDAIMKKIIKSHKTNRWNAIRDNKIGIQAYVRKNYKARNMDEVNLKVGQKVIIINQETELKNYWEVIVGGKNGLVPKDCIVFERGIAIFNYESKNEDELNFLVGDEITILNKETGEFGWYQGFNKGSIGFFPSNYIKLIHLDFIPPEDSIIDESFLYSHQRSEFSNSLPLEYNLPKNEQNPNSYIHKRTNIPEEINTSISSNPQEPSKPNMSNYGFSSNILNKSIEDVIIEEYKIPGLVNKNFNSTDNTIFLPKDISNKDNVELKKRQGMICDENITTTIDNDKIDKYYRNISGSSLKAHANDVEEVNGYIEEFEKGNNPNNSILDIQKVADTNQININNVRLDDIIDEKDIIDNKINIEVVLLRYIEKFVDNARELIDIDHYTSDHVFILRNCIDYLNKIADSTQVMVFTIKCKQTKSKLLMACKNVASSLAAVINSSKISCSAMYQQSQELINCLTHFIELINMNSGRYKEEVWNNVKSQIEEDRITLHSSIISNPKEEKISLHNYNNINHKSIYHFDDNLTVPNIHTNNSNANSKNPILEEILQNEFEILNSQVKEINADDDDNDDDDPSSEDASKTLDRLFSIMNSKSNLTIKSSSLNNKNKKVVCKDKNKNNNKINDHDNNKDINKKVKVVSSSINKLCSKNEIGEKNDKKLNDDKKNKIKVNHCTTSNSPLRNDSIRNEKKFQLNYKVISPHSKEALKNKIKSPNLDNSDDDSENYDISQIINSYSDINIDSIGINDNNDSNTTTGINGGSNKKNNNIQLEHILSPKCQFSEIKSNEIEIFNSNKNVIVSEINDFKDLNNSVDFSIEETRALNIVNLVKKDVDFLLKNYSGDANSSLCDEYTLKKIEALLQIIIEIRKTLILAISRQQEITDRVLINLDGNTSFTDEEEWNNSFAKNGMILADIFNLDNINNLLYQNNIAGNSKLNINGLNNKKSSNNNKTNSSDNNNIINNNNTIGNIVNPIDEIYNIELQSKKKDKKLVNTNYSVFDKKIVNPVKNRRYSLNSVNDYISKFNMTNTSPSMKSFNPLTYSPSNNILLNNNNNNINTISNNSKNTNLNTNLNLLSTTQTQTSFKPTLNIEYPSQNRDIFNDLINSLKTPIKNLIVSSELKNDFPSIIHDQLFNQYEKILTKNQNFTQIKS